MRKTVSIVLVLAGLAAGCMGGDDDEATVTTGSVRPTSSAVEEPPAPLPPSSFAAEPAPFRVVLTWDLPPEEVERFELFRDGTSIAIQSGSATSYTDSDVRPGVVYDYELASLNGELVSGRVQQSVETPFPPLRAARLDGTFNVRTRITSQSGYQDYKPRSFGWRFRPRCAEGPCDVRWSDLHTKQVRATLKRTGPRYRGTYTGWFFFDCGGSRPTSVVSPDFKVVKARLIGNEWRATRLLGTIDHSESAQLGCGSSHAEVSVRARLVE